MGISAERAGKVLQLFDDYYERVYCFARRLTPPDQAEDIAQEVFVRLLESKNLEKLTISVSYLLKTAENLIKRRYGRSQRFLKYIERTSRDVRSSLESEDDESEARLNDGAELDEHLGRLSPDERDAIRLIVCEGMSYEHAARSLGVPTTTVNNWKYRGLRKLQDISGNDDPLAARAGCV